jgi:RNA polymerase subunit RPABC4/transcription elongation factor Spt4
MNQENLPQCVNCRNFIDQCTCVCPYCGETTKCTCYLGIDKATGG